MAVLETSLRPPTGAHRQAWALAAARLESSGHPSEALIALELLALTGGDRPDCGDEILTLESVNQT